MICALAVGDRGAAASATRPLRTLLGRVAAIFGARGRESRTPTTGNPYHIDGPVDTDEAFIGRRLILDRIHRSLPNNSLFLCGERRIGKTSVLLSVERRLTARNDFDWRFVPMYTDLGGLTEDGLFPALERGVHRAVERLCDVPACRERQSVGGPHRGLVAAIRCAVDMLSREHRQTVKLVFLLDGIDVLNAFDPRVNQRLRSVFMTDLGEHLSAVAAGGTIDRAWECAGSPWYNFFEELTLGPMPRWEAEELVLRPASGRLSYEPAAVQAVIDLADCRPDRIQRLCHQLAHAALARGQGTVTCNAVRLLARRIHARR